MKENFPFLEKHGIHPSDKYEAFHMALALYLLYLVDAMHQAEDIEDGLVFDEMEITIIIENLLDSIHTVNELKNLLGLEFQNFDIAELVSMKECKLVAGMISGNKTEALKTARMWVQKYMKGGKNTFMYEAGVYILFLLGEEIDFYFIKKGFKG